MAVATHTFRSSVFKFLHPAIVGTSQENALKSSSQKEAKYSLLREDT